MYSLLYRNRYRPVLDAVRNRKGVLDVDTVKGCSYGMEKYSGGCYGLCYAARIAERHGFCFSKSVSRKIDGANLAKIEKDVMRHDSGFFRIGVMGDPSHDWETTGEVINWLGRYRVPVVITKHWEIIPGKILEKMSLRGVVVNTSVSALDSDDEIEHRLEQFDRIAGSGVRSFLRVVTARFSDTVSGLDLKKKQEMILTRAGKMLIDNPLRIPFTDSRVVDGTILAERHIDLGGGSTVSINNRKSYLGSCRGCPDRCGTGIKQRENKMSQQEMFKDSVEFKYVKSVIGSGYEQQVAKLAIEDGIAKRAARKNMQIHSAIILEINGEFSGFMTFQVNDECREFCLLQSVIKPEKHTDKLYKEMVEAVIAQNTYGYPSIITTDPKSKFETPKLFESLGFVTYLKMSGFHYMVRGDAAAVRHKFLAHITMTNVWNSVKGDWLNAKREWNKKIEAAGEAAGVPNPTYATREGCWQGANGYSQVVNAEKKIDANGNIKTETKAHNGNASVLDPVACEVVLRFFTPKEGNRVYNPFGGGVQFGYVAGSYGYDYVASEIRKNQCDANNAICAGLNSAKWVMSDSSTYSPDGEFDLVFTCPPYYKVEHYVDYNGEPPDGEINSMATYEVFRDTLFAGYKKAIEKLKDNRFFVVMTGDSRDKSGAYYCSESETELFFKDNGLSVYNKIIYLECEFTRLAHAKTTLNYRKFPKREQKIIVAYKGDIKKIRELFQPVGRL